MDALKGFDRNTVLEIQVRDNFNLENTDIDGLNLNEEAYLTYRGLLWGESDHYVILRVEDQIFTNGKGEPELYKFNCTFAFILKSEIIYIGDIRNDTRINLIRGNHKFIHDHPKKKRRRRY
jgi:hypothetical protein